MSFLKDCPFCGFSFNENILEDCVYPIRNGWRAGCNESAGGCTAEVLGASENEATENWNKRSNQVNLPA